MKDKAITNKISRRTFLKAAGITAAMAAVGGGVFLHMPKIGAAASGLRKDRIMASPNYVNGEFRNFEPFEFVPASDSNKFNALKTIIFPEKGTVVPAHALPSLKTDLRSLNPKEDMLVWMGHSGWFMQLGGRKILADPVFSSYASPVPFINRAFPGSNIYTAADMPDTIDVLLLSHDHWDHLDYATVMALKDKVEHIVCPLGVGAHFESWGFEPSIIHEGDWYDEIALADDFSIHVLPTRHFSGRLFERNQTLWGSFAFITPEKKIFFSGDGGYGAHFKQIGEKFGGFDLALMEDGQYNKSWPFVHMMPEETAQAAIDVKAKAVLPVHCGKFCLSTHRWQEPLERISMASEQKPYILLTPEIGQPVNLNDEKSLPAWWQNV